VVPHLDAIELNVSPASTTYVPPHTPPAWALAGMARNASRSRARIETWVKIFRDITYLLEMERTELSDIII